MKHRMNEHLHDTNSTIFKHHNAKHIDIPIESTLKFNILHKNLKYTKIRKLTESIYISKYTAKLMNGCEGYILKYNLS